MNGIVARWWFLEPCDCEKAAAARAAAEIAEKERKRIEEETAARQRRQARIEKLIGQSGIGRRFQMRTFDNFDHSSERVSACYEKCKDFADRFTEYAADGTGLFIAGTVGTGKTHLAAAIALQLLNEGVPVIFRTAIDMFADIRKAYSGQASESEILDTYRTVDLLVIDDLGKEKMTEWGASMLFGIINARYENMLPTIVTTNLDMEELRKSLGDEQTRAQAIISRLQETSIYLTMAWGDYRRR